MIRALILSRFDDKIGPVIMQSLPTLEGNVLEQVKNIPRFIDLMEKEQFFIHDVENIYSAHYFFEVNTAHKRGKREQLLISVIFGIVNPNERWIEQVVSFLRTQENTLKKMAGELKSNISVQVNGLLSPLNEQPIRAIITRYYTEIFILNAKNLFDKDIAGYKVWVSSPDRFNGMEILEGMKQVLKDKTNFRAQLMLFLLKQIRFILYNCENRQDESMECPVCKRHFLETIATLFVFNMDDGDANAVFSDYIRHLQLTGLDFDKPIIVIGVRLYPGENHIISDDINVIMELCNDLPDIPDLIEHILFAVVDLDDTETYVKPFKFLLEHIF